MKVTVLIENTKSDNRLVAEHGLSLFIETDKHNILLDAGETNEFANNAEKLGIDLKSVDVAVLSHGHSDHGGGLPTFTKINSKASVYVKDSAFDDHFNVFGKYIGIDKSLKNNENIIPVSSDLKIDDELFLFSNINGRRLFPKGNLKMRVIQNGEAIQDSFFHEQCLVVKTQKGNVLFSGCAHNGIVNILDTYRAIFKDNPYAVISGFHLMNNVEKAEPYTEEDIRLIESTAKELSSMKTLFFTGHCTGDEAFNIMKKIMPENLFRISTGMTIEL